MKAYHTVYLRLLFTLAQSACIHLQPDASTLWTILISVKVLLSLMQRLLPVKRMFFLPAVTKCQLIEGHQIIFTVLFYGLKIQSTLH